MSQIYTKKYKYHKKDEIAVLYPNGQARMYRSRMRDGEGKVELTVPMPGKFLSSVAVYGSGVFMNG